MLKGNIASQVGALYRPEDLRRADAFQIFYLGINAGVIAAPLVVGTLGEKIGWHWGFGAAGVGMLIALAIYIAGQKYLPPEHFEAQVESRARRAPKLTRTDWLATLALVLLIPVMAIAIVPNNQIFNAYLVWGDQQFDLTFMGTRLPDHLAGYARRDRQRHLSRGRGALLPLVRQALARARRAHQDHHRLGSSRSAACCACSPPPRPPRRARRSACSGRSCSTS